MRTLESSRSRLCVRVAAFVLIAASTAGCSSDTTRFKDNPFSSPMAARQTPAPEVTGTVRRRVDTQPLPAPAGPMTTEDYSRPAPVRRAELEPQHAPQTQVSPTARGWHPGPSSRTATAPHPVATGATHVVVRGETLMSISRHYGKHAAEIAQANHLPPGVKLRIGQTITIPGMSKAPVKTASAAPVAPVQAPPPAAAPTRTTPPAAQAVVKTPVPPPTQAAKPPVAPNTKVASTEPAATAHMVSPAAETPAAAPETTGTTPGFRWPVRGRVIGAFGAKVNGQLNDGINVSVPEGTSVKAAEDGVVAYSGNELKGYGNLVLVRHANGFVTAYAHASEVMVKRGDQVKRGQIIAKAGQTGGVSSPQLHFEIRKGSTPIDPMQHLSGG